MKKELIIVGMGEHGKVVLNTYINKKNKEYTVVGYLDDKEESNIFGIKYLGKVEDYNKYIEKSFHLALGNNKLRRDLGEKIGYNKLVNIIHDTAFISEFSKIGNGNYIGAMSVINQGCIIENNCIINTGSIVEHGSIIKNNSHLSYRVLVGSNVLIQEETYLDMGEIIKRNMKIGG